MTHLLGFVMAGQDRFVAVPAMRSAPTEPVSRRSQQAIRGVVRQARCCPLGVGHAVAALATGYALCRFAGHGVTEIPPRGPPIHIGPPRGTVAFFPDGQTAYVADGTSGTVIPISTATNTPGKPIRIGGPLGGISVTP